MKKFFKTLKRKFLTIFGDIKVYKWPMFVVYDPSQYLSGDKLEGILSCLRPGDIVCRGYKAYADSWFIPGKYSHSGIYIGDGKMIHAIAEGVGEVHVLSFLQCDRAVVLRLHPEFKHKGGREELIGKVIETARSLIGTKYDFDFRTDNEYLYCHELTATCYNAAGVEVKKHTPKLLWGLIRGKHKVYLAQSFLESPAFVTVCEA